MVLSTPLLIAYENREKYQKKYKKLMQKLAVPYLTNHKQWIEAEKQGLDVVDFDRIISQMANQNNFNDSIEKLATSSSYKVILTEEENVELPYVNYKDGLIDRTVSISLKPDEDRGELIKYLELMTSNATKVIICDNYLASNWDNTQALFRTVLPRHDLIIEYVETPDDVQATKNSEKITPHFVSSISDKWTVRKSVEYEGHHDRYLKIFSPDNNIEIMLSSGFDHIWKNNPKELTCVFRQI